MVIESINSLLQKHRPGELEAAAIRVDYPPGDCIIHNLRDVIVKKGPPPMLLFGASHVNHFNTYLKALKPQDKVKRVFSNSRFVGVGGTTWAKVLNDVQGNNPD